MNGNLSPSLIRTWVPMIVGAIVAWLTTKGVNLDVEAVAGLAAFLGGLFSALYYLVARLLEKKWPDLGAILLGSSKTPVYKEPKE